MFKIIFSMILPLLVASTTAAQDRIEKYSSLARDKKGAIAYQEQHEVKFVKQRVQRARTEYIDSTGRLIGEMSSDFTKKINVPDYEYKNLRNGTSHGLKLDGDKITLWHKNKDGEIKASDFDQTKFSTGTLLVGCQGLHYYLIDNLELVKAKKTIPIAYFIPGKLDYYRFTLNVDREDENYIYLKLSIDNFFLKLFASSLDLKYSKADRRLIQFSGLSNFTNDKDQMQNVLIDYKYD